MALISHADSNALEKLVLFSNEVETLITIYFQ